MDAESSKRLRGTLTETHIAETCTFGDVKNVLDRIRNIVPSKVIKAIVPKLWRVGTVVDRFFGIFVTPVVA